MLSVILRFLLGGCAVAVFFWNVGHGADVIRFLSVFNSLAYCIFLCYLFHSTRSETLQLWAAAADSFEIGDDAGAYSENDFK